MTHRYYLALLILLAGLLLAPAACAGTTSDTDTGADVDTVAEVDTADQADTADEAEDEDAMDEEGEEGEEAEDADEAGDADEADDEEDDDGGMGMQHRRMQDEMHAEMLAAAVEQGLFTQEDAEFFEQVHAVLDDLPGMEEGTGMDLDDEARKALQRSRTDLAVAENMLSQEDADRFTELHDLLIDNGLMHN